MRKQKTSSRSAFVRSRGRKAGRPRELKVKLKLRERKELQGMMSRGRESVRVLKRARILQLLDQGSSPEEAGQAIGVAGYTARLVGGRYVKGGLSRALWDAPRPGKERVFKGRKEQQLVAMLCGPCPEGRARWTIRLAAEEAVLRGIVPKADKETVRVVMNNHALKPWREKNVVRSGGEPGVHPEDGGRS